MKKVLGLDLGSRTCGIAMSDILGMIAHGVETFRFKPDDYLTCAKHVKEMFFSKTEKYEINFINRVLKNEFKLDVERMQRFIPFEKNHSTNQQKVSGTPFVYKNKFYNLKIEEHGTEQESDPTSERISYEIQISGNGPSSEGSNF